MDSTVAGLGWLVVIAIILLISNQMWVSSENRRLRRTLLKLSDPLTQSATKPYHHVAYYSLVTMKTTKELFAAQKLLEIIFLQRDNQRYTYPDKQPSYIPPNLSHEAFINYAKEKEWIHKEYGEKIDYLPLKKARENAHEFETAYHNISRDL